MSRFWPIKWLFLALLLTSHQLFAADADGVATQEVQESLTITPVSGLVFGAGAPGDIPKTIVPGTVDNAENASFQIQGTPNASYTITIPNQFFMTLDPLLSGVGSTTISINNPNIRHGNGTFLTGTLDSNGSDLLLVGATRASIQLTQAQGNYVGDLVVTVVY